MSDGFSAQPGLGSSTQATRYLCAAAYSDPSLANWVIDDVLEGKYRADAPLYGVDIVPVVRHCARARRHRLVRNLVLTAIATAGSVLLLTVAHSLIEGLLRIALLAWATIFLSSCYIHYEIVVAQLLRDRYDPDRGPRMSRRRERLLKDLVQRLKTNVTIYSGFSPFVGCGLDIGAWSFVVDTRKGKEDPLRGHQQPMPFQIDELYKYTVERMHDLQLERLRTESRLFVNGRELRSLPWLLPEPAKRPRTWVDHGIVDHFRQSPSEQVRHYLMVQLIEWDGELVLSIFLRFSVTGGNLFCEASYFLLPPVLENYHAVDDMNGTVDFRTISALFERSVLLTPLLLVTAPVAVLYRLMNRWTSWRDVAATRRLARQSPTFDYGAVTTLRQRAMSLNFRHYFQMLDKVMYVKLVEQQIFEAVISFLDARNIDTSDLKERQTTVLNNGVVVSGGQINAQSMAVGTGAKAWAGQAFKSAQTAPKSAGKQ